MHYVPEAQRKSVPQHICLVKTFYIPHLSQIQEDHDAIQKEFGEGAAAEWRKGLHNNKGQPAMLYAMHWDKWVRDRCGEYQVKPGNVADILRDCDASAFSRVRNPLGESAGVNGIHVPAVTNGKLLTSGSIFLRASSQFIYDEESPPITNFEGY